MLFIRYILNSPVRRICPHTIRPNSCLRTFSMSASMGNYGQLHPYAPPEYCNKMAYVPKHRLKMAQLPTPIHKWDLPGIPKDVSVFIKRDDMTGASLSGNKIRKLEFHLAEAVATGCKHVITCGGVQSNHCRATAVAARELGLQCHLLLRSKIEVIYFSAEYFILEELNKVQLKKAWEDVSEFEMSGNLVLDAMTGAHIYILPLREPYYPDVNNKMAALAQRILSETGETAYIVPMGGSGKLGLWGYVEAYNEMDRQGVLNDFDDIVFAVGSAGTAEGLAVAKHMSNSNIGLHGITVSDNAAYHYGRMNITLRDAGFNDMTAEAYVDFIDGYKGQGYAKSTEEELEFIMKISGKTGVFLDPVYTGKAAIGLIGELNSQPERFHGKKILFLHTGGIFSLFDGRMDGVLDRGKIHKL